MAEPNFVWYWCKTCHKTFPQKDLLKRHKKTVHHDGAAGVGKLGTKNLTKMRQNGGFQRTHKVIQMGSRKMGQEEIQKKMNHFLNQVEIIPKLSPKSIQINGSTSDSSKVSEKIVNNSETVNETEKIIPNPQTISPNLSQSPLGAGDENEGKKKSEHLNGILERLKLIAVQRITVPPEEDEVVTQQKIVQSSVLSETEVVEKTSSLTNLGDHHVPTNHSGERLPYHCQKCGKKFSSRKSLSIHSHRVHSPSSFTIDGESTGLAISGKCVTAASSDHHHGVIMTVPENEDMEKNLVVEKKIWMGEEEQNFLAQHIAPKILNGWTFHFCSLCLNIFPYYDYALHHVQKKHWPKRKNSHSHDSLSSSSSPIEKMENIANNNVDAEKNVLAQNDMEKITKMNSKTLEPPIKVQNVQEIFIQSKKIPPIPSSDSTLSRQIVEGSLKKLFCCNFCPSTFHRPSHAFRHSRTHSSRPFKCAGCDMTFRIQGTLEIHRKRRHRKLQQNKMKSLTESKDNSMLESWSLSSNLSLNEKEKKPFQKNGQQVTFYLADDFDCETEDRWDALQRDHDTDDSEEVEGQFCLCDGPADDSMVFCENADCTVKFFHLTCVGLTSPPSDFWSCAQCRNDDHHHQNNNKINHHHEIMSCH